MNEMVKTIKEIHSKDVCLFKIGSFYHAYGRDSYILSYLFDYKLKDEGNSIKTCGFPVTNVSKIMAKLENKKINYILLDRRNSYDVDKKSDNGNLNCYDAIYEKARRQINEIWGHTPKICWFYLEKMYNKKGECKLY